MYILLKRGELKEIISKAIKKSGSYKRLSSEIKINRQKIWDYKTKNVALKEERLNLILGYIGEELKSEKVEKRFPDNWRQIIGGKNCVKKKIKDGTLKRQLKESRKKIVRDLANWHKRMKRENPEAYYLLQYNHFKKVGEYKLTTINGEKVRNSFEKKVANILRKLRIPYEYETLVKAENRYFFPDFLLKNNIIIECTMWRGYDKAVKLRNKIEKLKDKYKVYVVIPEKISKYYETIKDNLILGIHKFEELAKTFK